MAIETAKDRRALESLEALTQQGSAEYGELVVTDAMVAAAEEAYMPFGDMRAALETALQAVVRTD